jgi:hypothetical protein
MSNSRGFGPEKPQPKVSQRSQERAKASQQLDRMKADGVPEFEVYLRVQGSKNWFPVGAIAVQRSALIHNAIFDNEEQLLQGAFRTFPILRKNQANLEYGYRLKEFKDEEIKVAVRPTAKGPGFVQGALGKLSGLLKR